MMNPIENTIIDLLTESDGTMDYGTLRRAVKAQDEAYTFATADSAIMSMCRNKRLLVMFGRVTLLKEDAPS